MQSGSTGIALLVATVIATGIAGCGKGSDSGAASSAAAAPAEPPVKCLDLPGASRVRLATSNDGATLYYVQYAGEIEVKDKSSIDGTRKRSRFELFKVAASGGAPQRIADDVLDSDLAIGPGGEVVYARIKSWHELLDTVGSSVLYVATPDGKETRLSSETGRINSIAVDAKGKRVFYTQADAESFGFKSTTFEVPLAGGEPKEVAGKMSIVWDVTPDGASLLTRIAGGLTSLHPIAGGEDRMVCDDGFNVALFGGGIVLIDKKTSAIQTAALPGGPARAVAWTQKDDRLLGPDGARFLIDRHSEGASSLLGGDGDTSKQLAHVAGGRFVEATSLPGGVMAVVVRYDTNGSGQITLEDESDICMIRGEGVELPAGRTVSKADLPLREKLAALATGDLAGARIALMHEPFELAVLTTDSVGPEDAEQLRTRAKTLQAEVAKVTGNDKIGARVVFAKNKKMGLAYYHPGEPGRLLLAGGEDGRLLYVPEQFDAELEPGTLWRFQTGSDIGSFSCKGKVKNRSAAPMTIQVSCALHSQALGSTTVQKDDTKPKTIAPGQTGTYDFYVGAGKEDDYVETSVLRGDKEIPFFNAFAQRKILEKK